MDIYRAEYQGKPCTVREVESQETIVTADGNVEAYPGDYVASDLAKAPRGYRSRHIERVIRAKDNRLLLGERVSDPVREDEPEADYFDDDE